MMDALQWEGIRSHLKIMLSILVKPCHPQETRLEEEDEDEDHAANDGENNDDVDDYEERIE